jgi:hypothetical protein
MSSMIATRTASSIRETTSIRRALLAGDLGAASAALDEQSTDPPGPVRHP